jgi:DNA polymerase-3 subunit delta'
MIAPWLIASWQLWVQRLRDQRIPHAVLVAGSQGLGKRGLVQAMTASLLCRHRNEQEQACGVCRECGLLTAGTHPDFYPINLALNDRGELRSEIGVEQIRELSNRLVQTSQFGGYRVAVLDPADAMTVSSFNALLKTLEEPEASTIMFLVSDQPGRLPATVRSRCQRIDVRFPPQEQALQWLAQKNVSPIDAEQALMLAAGNPGLALEICGAEQQKLLADTVLALSSLIDGKMLASELASRWAKDRAEWRLLLTVQLFRLAAWHTQGALSMPVQWGQIQQAISAIDPIYLMQCCERALWVRDQLKSPVRSDLLLLEWLRQFQSLVVSEKEKPKRKQR